MLVEPMPREHPGFSPGKGLSTPVALATADSSMPAPEGVVQSDLSAYGLTDVQRTCHYETEWPVSSTLDMFRVNPSTRV